MSKKSQTSKILDIFKKIGTMVGMKLKLYLLSRTDAVDYDEYDGAVVCAKSPKDARNQHSVGVYPKIVVKYLGLASPNLKEGLVLASYNAG